jgi:predicted aspartyl protease
MGANMRTFHPIDEFSRRRFVGGSAATLLLPQAIAHAQDAVPTTPEAQKIAAATDLNNHLTIGVMIGGKGPFRFVVDTGADRTVVSDEVAVALGLIRGPIVNVEGVVRSVSAQTVTLSDISFGPVRKEHLVVPVLPRALLGADGYLGLDTVDGSRVTFDFHNHALLIGESRHPAMFDFVRPNEVTVSVFGRGGHLRAMNCRVDGVLATTFIDSGAEVSVGNSALFDSLLDHDPTYMTGQTIMLTGVTGGSIAGRVTDLNHIKIDTISLYSTKIVISDLQIFDLWGLNDKPALLIGMNFLRAFNRVSIDYGRKELLFELASLQIAERA